MTRIAFAAVALLLSCSEGLAQSFPVVGATYQLDRGQFPEQVTICVTEQAMAQYIVAKATNDSAVTKRMLFRVNTIEDLARMKTKGGCTLISSGTQATVTQKGDRGIHRATFAAFPFEPMWGMAVYFGRRVTH